MIIGHTAYNVTPDIDVRLFRSYQSTTPFLVQVCEGTTIHMSLEDVQRLLLQLNGALYEYDTEYEYKETQ